MTFIDFRFIVTVEDVNECENKSLSQCSQFCINEVNSYHCSCKRGYKLSSDGKNCTGKKPILRSPD